MKSYLRRKYSLYDPIIAYDEDGHPWHLSDVALDYTMGKALERLISLTRNAWDTLVRATIEDSLFRIRMLARGVYVPSLWEELYRSESESSSGTGSDFQP